MVPETSNLPHVLLVEVLCVVEVLFTSKQPRVVGSSLHAIIELQGGLIASVHPHSVGARSALHSSHSNEL